MMVSNEENPVNQIKLNIHDSSPGDGEGGPEGVKEVTVEHHVHVHLAVVVM